MKAQAIYWPGQCKDINVSINSLPLSLPLSLTWLFLSTSSNNWLQSKLPCISVWQVNEYTREPERQLKSPVVSELFPVFVCKCNLVTKVSLVNLIDSPFLINSKGVLLLVGGTNFLISSDCSFVSALLMLHLVEANKALDRALSWVGKERKASRREQEKQRGRERDEEREKREREREEEEDGKETVCYFADQEIRLNRTEKKNAPLARLCGRLNGGCFYVTCLFLQIRVWPKWLLWLSFSFPVGQTSSTCDQREQAESIAEHRKGKGEGKGREKHKSEAAFSTFAFSFFSFTLFTTLC